MNECTGHEGYLVGGAVRDMLLGGKPKDFDILTTATPMQVLHLLLQRWRFPTLYSACSTGSLEARPKHCVIKELPWAIPAVYKLSASVGTCCSN